MKIDNVAPSKINQVGSLDSGRSENSGESFESSLMNILEAGEEYPREDSHDDESTAADLPSRNGSNEESQPDGESTVGTSLHDTEAGEEKIQRDEEPLVEPEDVVAQAATTSVEALPASNEVHSPTPTPTTQTPAASQDEVAASKVEPPTTRREVTGADTEAPTIRREVTGADTKAPTTRREVTGADGKVPTTRREVTGADTKAPTAPREVTGADAKAPTTRREVTGADTKAPTAPREVTGADTKAPTVPREVTGTVANVRDTARVSESPIEQVDRPQVIERAAAEQRSAHAARSREPTPQSIPAGSDPQSITDTAKLQNGIAASGREQQRQSHSGDERQEFLKPENAAARVSADSGEAARASAAVETSAQVQATAELAAATQLSEAKSDSSALGAATQANFPAPEVATAVAEPASPAGTGRPMPPEAIPQHIEWLVARGGGSAQIELHPPELGKLSIQVNVRGSDVQVVMNVQSAAAQTVVAEYRDTLESGLGSKDMKLDQFDIRDWANRDDSSGRETPADRGRDNSGDNQNGRGRSGDKAPHGIASALMQPSGGGPTVANDDGVNLRV